MQDKEIYKILGLSNDATDEEVENEYVRLRDKYSRDRFLEGEVGNEAARKLTKLENAYNEYKDGAKDDYFDTTDSTSFDDVENLIREGRLNEAQAKLDSFSNRNAEWHYIQSVIFYKKNWTNESKKQLEIALEMDPTNQKYSNSYNKLKTKMASNEQNFRSGNANYGADGNPETNRQMGGTNECMDFCATWCCMNMLCNICCR